MSKSIVLLVHGMGTHEKGNISEEFVAGVKEGAGYLGKVNYDISERVTLEEFNYSAFLDSVRDKLASATTDGLPDFESLRALGIGNDIVDKLLEFETDLTKDEMLYTHWLDIPLYAFFHYGESIRAGLAIKINELFKNNPNTDIHIICHSLGTAVVHDTLVKIYRKDADVLDNIPDFKQDEHRLKSIWSFANVSRLVSILKEIDNPDTSVVSADREGCADFFVNIRNKFDPFTWFKKYDRHMEKGYTYTTDIVKKINTHDFQQYVTEPGVTRHLLMALDKQQSFISNDILNNAIEKYKNAVPKVDTQKLEDTINNANIKEPSSLSDVFKAFKVLKKSIKDLIDREGE